jgi:hypothetical protein
MHILNIVSTALTDFFNRNEKTNDFLIDYALDFVEKDEIIKKLEKTAEFIINLKLKPKSYWYNKSNIFTLIIAIANEIDNINIINIDSLKQKLETFEKDIPSDYKLAATEAVNNKKERELRNTYISDIINASKNQ